MCVRDGDGSQPITPTGRYRGGHPGPLPQCPLQPPGSPSPCPGSSPDTRLSPAQEPRWPQWTVLPPLPHKCVFAPPLWHGSGALLGMLAHTEESEDLGGAGSQAGRRGYEARERKESAHLESGGWAASGSDPISLSSLGDTRFFSPLNLKDSENISWLPTRLRPHPSLVG